MPQGGIGVEEDTARRTPDAERENSSCLQCGAANPGKDRLCRVCRIRAAGLACRVYHFTPELHEALREAYRAPNKPALTKALDRVMTLRPKWPRRAWREQALALGLVHDCRTKWTPEQDRFLLDNAGVLSLSEMARRLGRTYHSAERRCARLGYSVRVSSGYGVLELAECFGVAPYKVREWFKQGLFRTGGRRPQQIPHIIRLSEEDVQRFIHAHPDEYDLRRVDQLWFKSMVFVPRGKRGEK